MMGIQIWDALRFESVFDLSEDPLPRPERARDTGGRYSDKYWRTVERLEAEGVRF